MPVYLVVLSFETISIGHFLISKRLLSLFYFSDTALDTR